MYTLDWIAQSDEEVGPGGSQAQVMCTEYQVTVNWATKYQHLYNFQVRWFCCQGGV